MPERGEKRDSIMNAKHLSCEEVMAELFAYLDRELNDDLKATIDEHLQRCRDCFTRAEFEKRLRAKITQAATVKAPERLQRRIRYLLDRY